MPRALDPLNFEAARSAHPKEWARKIREILERSQASELLNGRSRPGFIEAIAANYAPVEAIFQFLHSNYLHLESTSLAIDLSTVSTSASVLNPETLSRTVPSPAQPRASCVRGAQCSPVRHAIPKLSSSARPASSTGQPSTRKETTGRRSTCASSSTTLTPAIDRSPLRRRFPAHSAWRRNVSPSAACHAKAAHKPAMPGKFGVPASSLSGIAAGCEWDWL